MVATPQPIATDVLLFMDDLRRDPSRRHLLSASWEIYRAAVAAGLIADGAIDDLAVLMQELVSDDRIAFTTVSGGVIAPTPGAPWSGTWLQQLHGWRITGQGREEAARLRAEVASGSRPETVPASPMGSATSRPAMARRLAGELEESEDLLGRAIETSQFWAPPRKCPDFRWRDYEEELAAISPATHKAVGDAYRKLNDLNWTVPARAAQEQPGAILGTGEGLRLDDGDCEHLRGVLGVIRDAKDHLDRFAAGTSGTSDARPGEHRANSQEHWRWQIDYVFGLPAPTLFPVLADTPGARDHDVLRRYISQAADLGRSAVLNDSEIGYTVRFTQGETAVDPTMPSKELIAGLAVLFRQLYLCRGGGGSSTRWATA